MTPRGLAVQVTAADLAIRSTQIAIKLFEVDLDHLKAEAKRHGVGHTTLARTIIEKWVASTRGTPVRR